MNRYEYHQDITSRRRGLRLESVIQKTGLSKSYTYKLIHQGLFPAPHKVTNRVSIWDEREIDSWLEDKFSDTKEKASEDFNSLCECN